MAGLTDSEESDGHLGNYRGRRCANDHLGTVLRRAGVRPAIVVRHSLHRHGALGLWLCGSAQAHPGSRERAELNHQQHHTNQKAHEPSVPGWVSGVKLEAPPVERLSSRRERVDLIGSVMRTRWNRGVQSALLAALLFGASTPLAKGLLSDLPPQVLAGLLYLGSGVGLGALWLWRRRTGRTGEAPVSRRDLPWLLGAIGFGGGLGPLLLLVGLRQTPASGASLLLNLEGVFTALMAWFIFHENVDRRVALGMLALLLGGGLLVWQGRLDWGGILGPLAIAGACACWAIDNNLTQKISASDPIQIAALKGGVAGTVNLAIGLVTTASLPTLPRTLAALTLGFFGYGVSLVLFVLALRSLGTARTGAYFSTAPFVGAILSVVLWRESPTPVLLASGLLMGIGVWLHLSERHGHVHVHESLSHSHPHLHDEHHHHAHSANDPPGEPHTHSHAHEPLAHSHRHYPDIHHRHAH